MKKYVRGILGTIRFFAQCSILVCIIILVIKTFF